ncbi:MAG: class I mannose-6-phosphate isomerase [Planctomycetaceae bacterium]|jgi:mannose-6-phosphate isomerase|nr:class I mannose-6-phosphate isomerase [Planctomycetaceae bacterium]
MTRAELECELPLYPFRFKPIYKNYIWGGHKLANLFGRKNITTDTVAESWEVADHEHGESIVTNGPLRGNSLEMLLQRYPETLLGDEYLRRGKPKRFPLMFKHLDAMQNLSVQVHPNNAVCCELGIDEPEKVEAWVILDANVNSHYYAGFKKHCTPEQVQTAVQNGTITELLNPILANKGDCVLIKPGVVHALGEGVLAAEVAVTSDTTFRLFDWNRKDANGNSRELHVAEAIKAIDYNVGIICPQRSSKSLDANRETLVWCDEFKIDRWTTTSQMFLRNDNRCAIWTVVSGSASVIFTAGRRTAPMSHSGRDADPDGIEPLNRGDTLLIPAMASSIRWVSEGKEPLVMLSVSLL